MNALILASGLAVPIGCVATVEPEPVYAEATDVPPHIETYPYVIYEGRPVYYVGERWYYRRGPSWVYYRSEPAVLHRQRPYVQQAPRAYPRREYRRPEYSAPPPRYAPPATQVR